MSGGASHVVPPLTQIQSNESSFMIPDGEISKEDILREMRELRERKEAILRKSARKDFDS